MCNSLESLVVMVRLLQSWTLVSLTDALDAELEEIERRDMANCDVDVTPFFACQSPSAFR